ncbi:hypothetical protein H7169_01195 [Candidatus Gracilibacteria bacterium]|nr:hypothetical protein [Candidatus Gracilibacteria bacterium]
MPKNKYITILVYLSYGILAIGAALILHFVILFISVVFTRHNNSIGILYPYISDGCTLYEDDDYRDCCEAHDRAYWQGGPLYKKLVADANLYACIAEKGHDFRENWMFAGVLFGGNPGLPTTFRWGFGFPYPYYDIQEK